MERDPKKAQYEFDSFEFGTDSGTDSRKIRPDQVAFAINGTNRGKYYQTRPPFQKLTVPIDSTARRFQHLGYYKPDLGPECLMLVANGRVFKMVPSYKSATVYEITIAGDPNASNRLCGWSWQAEKWWIFNDGQSRPFVHDGASSRRTVGDELKVGTVLTYVMGRVWYANHNGLSFRAGDLVRSSSGTPANRFRDAVIKETENTFLNENGDFSVPSSTGGIRAMKPASNLDSVLGQGPLQVFTPTSVFSVQTPVDRTTWQDVTYPIQTIGLIDFGAVSQDSVVYVNGDLFYRAGNGIWSYKLARREFQLWGNTPQSSEVERITDFDQKDLLGYSSGVNFSNRMLQTCSPVYSTDGVYHRGLLSLNFESAASLVGKAPAAWESLWTGLKIYQVIQGKFAGVDRAFAAVRGNNGGIEIWELLADGNWDNNGDVDSLIPMTLELPNVDFGSKTSLKRLFRGELYADQMIGNVNFNVQWRPDSYPCWIDWQSWSECATYENCQTDPKICDGPKNYQPQYRPKMGLQQPPDTCDASIGRLFRDFFTLQTQITITGKARLIGGRFIAQDQGEPPAYECRKNAACKELVCCNPDIFAYNSDPSPPYPG